MQVLKDHHERLPRTLPEEEPLHRVRSQAAAVVGVFGRDLFIPFRQQIEEARHGIAQALVQGEQPADHLLAHFIGAIFGGDAEIAAQDVDQRQIGCRLAEGDRRRFQDEATARAVQPLELQKEARLADTGVTHDAHDLPVAPFGELQRLL